MKDFPGTMIRSQEEPRARLFISRLSLRLAVSTALALAASHAWADNDKPCPPGSAADPLTSSNDSGLLRTFTPTGKLDTTGAFFQSLGTNGRSCASCHQPGDAWSITPVHLQERFNSSQGTDPVFRPVDGANSPKADVSSVKARQKAYSMLLNRGLIRVGIGIPAGAEFTLIAVDDPYQYASAKELSLFRRPLPSTNLRFLTGVMWDGRETSAPFVPPMDPKANITDLLASLAQQATDATTGHAQATAPPTAQQLQQIVDFEMDLTTAQVLDNDAGYLNALDALGGPRILANQNFFVAINDTLGADPTGASFDPSAMSLFSAWSTLSGSDANGPDGKARASIARGEVLFNTKPIQITGVIGLNDALNQTTIQGTCTTCHSTPNVGNHSVTLPLNIGLTDESRRTADMPLYTLQNNTTLAIVKTTDPGKALLSGKWKDIGKFKGPILRGLAARPPYFHNGLAPTLTDAVNFYNTRFNIGLTNKETADLVAFLGSL